MKLFWIFCVLLLILGTFGDDAVPVSNQNQVFTVFIYLRKTGTNFFVMKYIVITLIQRLR